MYILYILHIRGMSAGTGTVQCIRAKQNDLSVRYHSILKSGIKMVSKAKKALQ